MIEQLLHKLLAETDAIAAQAEGGVHIAERPQRYGLPAVVIGPSSEEKDHGYAGADGTAFGEVTVSTLGRSVAEARDLMELVRLRIDGFAGVILAVPAGDGVRDVEVSYLLHEDERTGPSDHRDGQGRIATHLREANYAFALNEPQPTLA